MDFSLLKWPPNLVEYFTKDVFTITVRSKVKSDFYALQMLGNARYRDGGNN